MSGTAAGLRGGEPAYLRLVRRLRSLEPPVRQRRFWVVQVGVVVIALVHDVVLVEAHAYDAPGAFAPITAGLLIVPVIYAALNFGVQGAVATSLWASALIVPHWLVGETPTSAHLLIEVSYLLVLNVVAVVVGQRVEHEQGARRGAEAALQVARNAEARYYTLFDDQPAPVIVTDADGQVVELNAAASRLVGRSAIGQRLEALVGPTVTDLLADEPPLVSVADECGDQLLFTPTAHRVTTADDVELVQLVLTDVTEQRRRQDEQRLFAARLLTVQEEERRRLARELHDDPLQQLTYLTRTLDDLSHGSSYDDVAQRLAQSSVVATEASSSLRKLIQGLRPPVLDDLGLVAALRQLAAEARSRTALAVDLRVTGSERRLPPDLELATYRIAQEALNNVVRHAGARRVSIRLDFDDDLVLSVADDGCGMPLTARSRRSRTGLGLVGMRERVNMAGGSLQVSPRSPHGTRVRATLPMPAS